MVTLSFGHTGGAIGKLTFKTWREGNEAAAEIARVLGLEIKPTKISQRCSGASVSNCRVFVSIERPI